MHFAPTIHSGFFAALTKLSRSRYNVRMQNSRRCSGYTIPDCSSKNHGGHGKKNPSHNHSLRLIMLFMTAIINTAMPNRQRIPPFYNPAFRRDSIIPFCHSSACLRMLSRMASRFCLFFSPINFCCIFLNSLLICFL